MRKILSIETININYCVSIILFLVGFLICSLAYIVRYEFRLESVFISPFLKENKPLVEHFIFALGAVFMMPLLSKILYFSRIVIDVNKNKKFAITTDFYMITFLAFIYLMAHVIWEMIQAFFDVYGGGPRGYYQFDQSFFDLIGVFIGLLLVKKILSINCCTNEIKAK